MRAIVLEKFGGPDSLVYTDLPEPEPMPGQVVIEIKAFGLNHAEMHMRRGEWAEAPKVIGIECVGLVKSCPGGEFPVGAKVAALMGGLGRTINGSYAEYTSVRASNVALIESDLPWAELAAIPETYATAWTCLFRNLEIARGTDAGHTGRGILIRPGRAQHGGRRGRCESSPRRAVVSVSPCCSSSAQSASKRRRRTCRTELPKPSSSTRCSTSSVTAPFSTPSTCCGGAVAPAWRGGSAVLAPIADFNPLQQMASGVYLTFFGSFVFGTPQFPLSDVPLQKIAELVAAGRSRRSRAGCSASRRSVRLIASWKPAKPAARWWSSTIDRILWELPAIRRLVSRSQRAATQLIRL